MPEEKREGQDYQKLKEKALPKTLELQGQVTPEEDSLSLSEEIDYELKLKEAQLESYQQDVKERKRYAFWIFFMVAIWLLLILLIIFLVGLGIMTLSDAVVISLITSTTINVAAFFLVVTKYLFPSNND
jgi:hypothetical protein